MKYTKLITGLTALVTTAMLFTGCACEEHPYDDWEVPTFGSENTYSTTVETTHETKDEKAIFEAGDFVWCVWHINEDELCPAQAVRYKVIASFEEEGYIVASNYFFFDDISFEEMLEEMKHQTMECDCSVYVFPIEDCYMDREEAKAIADAENAEYDYEW